MSEKLILFDVDNTLIDHAQPKSYIPEATKKAILALKEAGHHVGLATGRSWVHVRYIMDMLHMDTAVCFAGHLIIHDDEIVEKTSMDQEQVNRLIEQEKGREYPIMAMDENFIYIHDSKGRIRQSLHKSKDLIDGEKPMIELTPLKELDGQQGPFLSMMFFHKDIDNQESYDLLDFNPWGDDGYEVYAKGVSKLSGIEHLVEHLKISMDDVYVFGDSYNDLHMLEHIKHSVAVGNGVEAAKKVASYVAPPIGEGGILTACKELGLLKKMDE